MLIPRPVSSERLQGQSLADRAEDVTLDNAGRGDGFGDRLADMGEFHGAAGQEHRVDVSGAQPGLCEAVLDARRNAIG